MFCFSTNLMSSLCWTFLPLASWGTENLNNPLDRPINLTLLPNLLLSAFSSYIPEFSVSAHSRNPLMRTRSLLIRACFISCTDKDCRLLLLFHWVIILLLNKLVKQLLVKFELPEDLGEVLLGDFHLLLEVVLKLKLLNSLKLVSYLELQKEGPRVN